MSILSSQSEQLIRSLHRSNWGTKIKRKSCSFFRKGVQDANGETVGAEAIQDLGTPSMEELAIAGELSERLRHIVAALPRAERELIQAIYFEDIPVCDYAKRIGLTHRGVNKQRKKILSKLKMLLDIMGSF